MLKKSSSLSKNVKELSEKNAELSKKIQSFVNSEGTFKQFERSFNHNITVKSRQNTPAKTQQFHFMDKGTLRKSEKVLQGPNSIESNSQPSNEMIQSKFEQMLKERDVQLKKTSQETNEYLKMMISKSEKAHQEIASLKEYENL